MLAAWQKLVYYVSLDNILWINLWKSETDKQAVTEVLWTPGWWRNGWPGLISATSQSQVFPRADSTWTSCRWRKRRSEQTSPGTSGVWARLSTTSLNMASWCGKSGYSWSTGLTWRQPILPSTTCRHHKWRMSCRESTKATMVVRKLEQWPLCSNWLLIWSQLPHLSGHRWTACTKCLMLGGMVLSSRCRSSQGSRWGWWTTGCWKKDWIEGWHELQGDEKLVLP